MDRSGTSKYQNVHVSNLHPKCNSRFRGQKSIDFLIRKLLHLEGMAGADPGIVKRGGGGMLLQSFWLGPLGPGVLY